MKSVKSTIRFSLSLIPFVYSAQYLTTNDLLLVHEAPVSALALPPSTASKKATLPTLTTRTLSPFLHVVLTNRQL